MQRPVCSKRWLTKYPHLLSETFTDFLNVYDDVHGLLSKFGNG